MSSLKMLTALACLSLPIAHCAAQCNQTWNPPASFSATEWGVAANWTVNSGTGCTWPGQIPNNGDTAIFDGNPLVGIWLIADFVNIINPSITNLQLSTLNYTIYPERNINSACTLGFDTSAVDTLTVGAGTTQTINAPIVLNGANPFTVTVNSSSTLNITSPVTDPLVLMPSALIYSGPGTLNIVNLSPFLTNPGLIANLNGSTTSMSNTGALFINSGTFQITNNLVVINGNGTTLNLTDSSNANTYIYGGTLALVNNSLILGTGSFGAYYLANGGIFLPTGSGALTLTNNAQIMLGGNIGCYINIATGQLSVGSGTSVLLNNLGQIDDGQNGAQISCSSLTLNNGSITLTNSGQIGQNNAWGTFLSVVGSMTMTGAGSTFLIHSTGSNIINSGGIGSYVNLDTFSQSNGLTQVTSTNTGGGSGLAAKLIANTSIDVTGGTFQNDVEVLSPMITVSGGTLCGTGTFAGTIGNTSVTNMGATVIAGDTIGGAPGVLTIAGDYTQNSAGTFAVNLLTLNGDVPGPTSFSQLDVSGTASIAGSVTVALSPGQTVRNGDAYTILTSNILTGTFAGGVIPISFPVGYSAALSYPVGHNDVVLTITAPPLPALPLSPPSPPLPPSPPSPPVSSPPAPLPALSACTETWNGTTVNWGEAANWTGGACAYPGVVANNGDTAMLVGNTQLQVRLTESDGVTFINPSITHLNLTTANYTIYPDIPTVAQIPIVPMASLGFDTSALDTITVGAGTTQIITAPIVLNSANPLTVTVDSNATLDIVGTVTDAGTSTLVFSGPGTLNFVDNSDAFYNPNAVNTLSGTTTYMSNVGSLFINSGTLKITNNIELLDNDGPHINLSNITNGNAYIYGGTLALENNGELVAGNCTGAYFSAMGSVFLPSGSGAITMTNNATCKLQDTTGCYLLLVGDLSVGPGTSVLLLNTADVGDSQNGSRINLDGNVTIDNGSITMTNSGGLIGPDFAWGTSMQINNNITMTGANSRFILQSTGSDVITTGGYGCYVICTNFSQSDGVTQLLNTNTGGGGGTAAELITTTISITGGKFQNDSSAGASSTITVSGADTILCGSGIFAGSDSPPYADTSLTNIGSTLIAGDTIGGTPGVMTIVGDFTQNSGGTFAVNILTLNGDVPGPTSFSQLVVTGTATLEGSVTAALSPGQTVMNGDAYTILTSNGLTGTFELGVIPVNFPPGYSAVLSYITMSDVGLPPTNAVILTFVAPIPPPPPPSPPGPPSPALLGLSLKSYPAYYQSIFASVNHTHTRLEREMRGLRNRFNTEKETTQPVSRSPSSSGVIPSAGKIPMELIQSTSNQVGKDRAPSVAFFNLEQVQKQHQLTQKLESGETRPWNIYLGPIGTSGEINTKHAAVGYNEWSAGALTGFDYAFSHVGIGIMADYERVQGYVNHHWGEFSIHQAHVSAYFTYAPKPLPKLGINAIVGGGYDWVDIHRHTEGKTAKGDSQVGEFDALVGLEYTFVKEERCGYGQLQFTPMVNVQYIYLDIDRYREHSAGIFDFKIHGQVAKSLRTTLGTWLGYLWEWCDFAFKPEVYLAWQREYFDHNHTLYVNPLHFLAPTTSIGMQGEGRNTYQAGLDLMFTLFNKYGLEASYDFEWNHLFHDHAFYLGFNVQF